MADFLPQPQTPVPQPGHVGNAPDGGEAKAKAHELKDKDKKAREDAAKDGNPVQGEGIKPTNVSVPPVPAPKATAKTAPPQPPQAAPKPKAALKDAKAPKDGPGHDSPKPQKGPAANAAAASIDAEVADALNKAPHDKSKEETHGTVQQLADAAKQLQSAAPPAAKPDGAIMGAAKMFVPGMDLVGAKNLQDSDLGKMWSGLSGKDNPYAQFNSKLGVWAQRISRIRDVASGLSSILGKIGMVLTVVGVVISITGIGAPLGAPIATIGRVLGIITLVLDVITFALSAVLMGLTAAMLKDPNVNPEQRKLLAQRFLAESQNTTQALVSVAMAMPGLGKLAGMAAGGAMKIVKGIAMKLGKFIGKLGLGAVKGIAVRLAQAWSKVKGLFKFGEKAAAKEVGFIGKTLGKVKDFGKAAWSGTKNVAGSVWGGIKSAGGAIKNAGSNAWTKIKSLLPAAKPGAPKGAFGKAKDWVVDKATAVGKSIKSGDWIEKLNKNLEGKMTKFNESNLGKAFDRMDKASLKFNEKLDKWTGKELLEKGENAITYGFTKAGAATDRLADSWATKIENKIGGKAADDTAKAAEQTATQGVKAEEKGIVASYKEQTENALRREEQKVAEREEKILADAKREQQTLQAQEGGLDKNVNELERLEQKHAKGQISDPKFEKEKAKLEEKIREKTEKIDASRERVNAAEERAAEVKTKRTEKLEGSEADARAKERLDQLRGKDAEGNPAKQLTEEQRKELGGWRKELDDATHYKDPKKETALGIYAEKLGEPIEQNKLKKEWGDEYQKGMDEKAAEMGNERAHEAAERAHEHVEQHQGEPEPAAVVGPAPHIAELDGGEGGAADRVHNLIGNLDPQAGKQKETKGKAGDKPDEHKAETKPPEPAKQQPAGDHKADAGHEGGEGAAPEPGAVPYWPALLDGYKADLKLLDQTEGDLHKYRDAQIAGYKAALGIKEQARSEKDKAAARKPAQETNKKDAQGDAKELLNSSKESTKVGSEAQKGDQEKGKGTTAGEQGAEAASTPVPEPPAPHWWDRIINAIKGFLVKYIQKGLKFIQDAIANAVLKMFGNMSLEDVNALAHGMGDRTKQDAAQSKESEAQTTKAEGTDKASEAKAEGQMTEAEKLYQQTTANVKSADELLVAIADVRKLLNQEIQQGTQFISDVKAAKEKEKQELLARHQREEQAQKDAAAKQQKDARDHAPKDGEDHVPDEEKDEADAAQVGLVKQAAQIVATTSTEYHTRVTRGFAAARGSLAGEVGRSGVDREHATQAVQAFDKVGGEVVSASEKKASSRSAKMQAVVGKSSVPSGELAQMAHEVQEAAADADETLKESLEDLRHSFEEAYVFEHKPSEKPAPRKSGADPTWNHAPPSSQVSAAVQ